MDDGPRSRHGVTPPPWYESRLPAHGVSSTLLAHPVHVSDSEASSESRRQLPEGILLLLAMKDKLGCGAMLGEPMQWKRCDPIFLIVVLRDAPDCEQMAHRPSADSSDT